MAYNVAIATTAAALTASSGQGSPMTLAPSGFKRIPQQQVITASGLRKLVGLPGWQLFWQITDAADVDDIMDRTGGSSASSIAGAIRIKDWIPRSSSAETWSVYTCFLDQPVEGEFRVGNLRYNLMVAARQLVLYETLA